MVTRSRFLPEPDPRTLAPFAVPERDAHALLVALFERGLPVWVFPAGGSADDYVLSQILAVVDRRLELEIGPDRRWDGMAHEPAVVLVSFLDRVKLQLRADAQGVVDVDGEARFAVARTGDLHRLQRRDGFRLRLPDGDPATCHLREADGSRFAVPVLDVSVVGVALIHPSHRPPPEVGRRFRGARLQLPDALLLPCDLVVRQVAEDPGGTFRVGCAYEPMAPEVARRLQRAILDLERRFMET